MRLLLIAALFLALARPVPAGEAAGGFPPMAEMFEAPCRELAIPCPAARAIAEVESGLYPWSLNIEGRSFRFKSKSEALAKARSALASGRSFDVGLMQVNSWWLKKYGIALEAALDPLANIYLGGWILKSEIDRHKDLRAAVGAYHSPDPAKARRYAEVVMAAVARGPVEPSDSGKARRKKPGASIQKSASPALVPMKVNQEKPSSINNFNSSSMKVRSIAK